MGRDICVDMGVELVRKCISRNDRVRAIRDAAMKGNRLLGYAYLAPYIIGLMVFTAIPFVVSFYLSFTSYDLMN